MTNKNIVLFSSGVSERNGILGTLNAALTRKGYTCAYWRDLFKNAKDSNNIALLPMLIKKIPTFDYAVLVCEGHDVTAMRRGDKVENVITMRDNVLFEIGLCVMALGLNRTVLVTDSDVRMPDDLTGIHNSSAVKRIVYDVDDRGSYARTGDLLIEHLSETETASEMETASEKIDQYIRNTGNTLTPVVIGAASSIACGYVSNFIFRTLEHIDDGVYVEDSDETLRFPREKIYMHICLPDKFDRFTSERAAGALGKYRKGKVLSARNRHAEFRFKVLGDELHIVDFPTSIVTSYDTARMILNINADDTVDLSAADRFTSKELNLFEATLRTLLDEEYLRQVAEEQYPSMPEREREKMTGFVLDIIKNRVFIEHENYENW